MLSARKNAIRRLGATWLRPPGVTKTMQALADERAERAEAEELARREAAAQEMRAAQEAEEARARGDTVEEERDLDDAVPDAGDEGYDSGEDETGLEDEIDAEDDGATVDESGVIDEDADADMGEDLDADVPYAESYEHTDTEVEDEPASELEPGGGRLAAAQDEQSEITNTSDLLDSSLHHDFAATAASTPPPGSQHPANRVHPAGVPSLHSGVLGRQPYASDPSYSRLSAGPSTRISGTVGTPGPPRALFDARLRLTPTLTRNRESIAQWRSGEREYQASGSSVNPLGWRGFGVNVGGGIGAGLDGEADEDDGSEMVFSSPAATRGGAHVPERRTG